jgi:hypothetical protein
MPRRTDTCLRNKYTKQRKLSRTPLVVPRIIDHSKDANPHLDQSNPLTVITMDLEVAPLAVPRLVPGAPEITRTGVCSNSFPVKHYQHPKPNYARGGEEESNKFSAGVHNQSLCMPMAARITEGKICSSYRPRLYPEIEVLCHHAETNYIFLLGGRVGLSPLSKSNTVEFFLVETLLLQIGFKLPSDIFSRIFLYWEQSVSENYLEHKYSLYVANVNFRDFINSCRNIGGAQALISKIHFKEELFNLEQAGKPLLNRTETFEPPQAVDCHYCVRHIKVHDYANREPKTTCVDYGLLTHISEIRNNLGIDIGVIPNRRFGYAKT